MKYFQDREFDETIFLVGIRHAATALIVAGSVGVFLGQMPVAALAAAITGVLVLVVGSFKLKR